MGTKGREIVGEHAERVVELLNRALADEWSPTTSMLKRT
jgi:bacterioferritin